LSCLVTPDNRQSPVLVGVQGLPADWAGPFLLLVHLVFDGADTGAYTFHLGNVPVVRDVALPNAGHQFVGELRELDLDLSQLEGK